MELHLRKSFSFRDINKIFENKIEESFYLDYKSADSLGFEDHRKDEISKDISSFANSDGGIIIYGIKEVNHLPQEITPINGQIFTKEWLEHIITDKIQRRIPDLHIFPIRLDDKIETSLYVVKIPASPLAPHMCNNGRYYKRYDFKVITMMEYEVRHLYSRALSTLLTISAVYLETKKDYGFFDEVKHREFEIGVLVKNIGRLVEKDYKIKLQLKSIDNFSLRYSYSPDSTDLLMEGDMENSFVSKTKLPLFPDEDITCLKLNVHVPFENELDFKNNCILKIKLLYSSGIDEAEYKLCDMEPIKKITNP